MSLALVLAGGGKRAVAWERGVLAGLELPEPDLVVGTSSGSYVASSMFAAPPSFSAAVEAWLSGPPKTRRRVVIGPGHGVPVRTAVASAGSIPGEMPPSAVGSATNADVASSADRVVIVTPNPAEAPENTLFCSWQQALEEEIEALEGGGSEVLLVQAGPEDQAAMGRDFMSGERAREAFAAGRSRGRLLQYTVRCRR